MKFSRYIKNLTPLALVVAFSGCGPSYKDVKPGYSAKPVNPVSVKYTTADLTQSNLYPFSRIGAAVTEMKIAKEGNNNLIAMQTANKLISFSYLEGPNINKRSALFESSTMIIIPADPELRKMFIQDINKIAIKPYKVGSDTMDLKNNGNFVYISANKHARVLERINPNNLHDILGKGWKRNREISTLKSKYPIQKVIFQPTKNRLLMINSKNSIELWDYKKKRRVKTIGKHKTKILAAKFSKQGRYLATADELYMYVWDMKTFKKIATFEQRKTTAIAFSNDSKQIAVTGDFSNVLIYSIKEKKRIKHFAHGHRQLVYGLLYDPKDEATLITAGQDGAIKTWNLPDTSHPTTTNYNTYDNKQHCDATKFQKQHFILSKSLSKFIDKYNPKISSCNLLGNKKQIIDYANREILNPYMLANSESLLMKHNSMLQERLSDINNQLAQLPRAKEHVKFLNTMKGIVKRNPTPKNIKEYNSFKADMQYKNMKEIKAAEIQLKKDKKAGIENVKKSFLSLIAQMNSSSIYGLVTDGEKIIPFGTGFRERISYNDDSRINRTSMNRFKIFFSYKPGNKINMYELTHRQTYSTGRGRYDEIIAKDDNTLITTKDNIVEIWNLKDNTLEDTIKEDGRIFALAYDAIHDTIAIGSSNKTIKIWDLKNKKLLTQLVGHTDNVTSLEFAKKGTILISGGADEQAIIWDLKSKKIVTKMIDLGGYITDIQVNPNQKDFSMTIKGMGNYSMNFYSTKDYKLIKKFTSDFGRISAYKYIENGTKILAVTPGEDFKKAGHIAFVLDTKKYTVLKKSSFQAPFDMVTGIYVNEAQKIFIIGGMGRGRYLQQLSLNTLTPMKNIDNGAAKYGRSNSIDAVGSTKSNSNVVVGNRQGELVIHY